MRQALTNSGHLLPVCHSSPLHASSQGFILHTMPMIGLLLVPAASSIKFTQCPVSIPERSIYHRSQTGFTPKIPMNPLLLGHSPSTTQAIMACQS